MSTPGTCSICSRADAAEIDQARVSGESVRDVSRRFGLTKSSVARHSANHLRKNLREAAARHANTPADGLLEQIGSLTEETLRVLRRALRAKDLELALKAIARAERQAEIVAKLTGRIREGATTIVNFNVADPEAELRMVLAELTRRGYRIIPPGAAIEVQGAPALSPAPPAPATGGE